jgi:hypothetical protein
MCGKILKKEKPLGRGLLDSLSLKFYQLIIAAGAQQMQQAGENINN